MFAQVEDEFDLAYGLVELAGDFRCAEPRFSKPDYLGLNRFGFWFSDWFGLLLAWFDPSCDAGLAFFEVLIHACAIEQGRVDCACGMLWEW